MVITSLRLILYFLQYSPPVLTSTILILNTTHGSFLIYLICMCSWHVCTLLNTYNGLHDSYPEDNNVTLVNDP